MAQPFGSNHAHVPLEHGLPTLTRQSASYPNSRAHVPGLPPHPDYLAPDAIPLSDSSLPSSVATSLNNPQIPAWTTSYTTSTRHDENNPEPPYVTQANYLSTSPPQIDNAATVPMYYTQAYEGFTPQIHASSSIPYSHLLHTTHHAQGHTPFRPSQQGTNQLPAYVTAATTGLPSSYDFTFTAQPQMVLPHRVDPLLLQYGEPSTSMSASYPASLGPVLPLPDEETALTRYSNANSSSLSQCDGFAHPPVPVSLQEDGYFNGGAYTGLQPTDVVLPDVASTYLVEGPTGIQQQSFVSISEGEISAPDAVDPEFNVAISLLVNVLSGGRSASNDLPLASEQSVDTVQQESAVAPNVATLDIVAPQPTYPAPSYQPSTGQASGSKRSSPSSDDGNDEGDYAEVGDSGESAQKRRRLSNERYLCHKCNVTVMRSRQRHHEASKRHLQLRVGLFWCSTCEKDYARKDSLKRHFQSKHPHLLEYPQLLEPRLSPPSDDLDTSQPTSASD
ncbi:hypothetical protein F5I97DRAFT_1924070 [Phlebopus sp. FC_14]|nr:hypothetical protein F5I97DRAFT_1924070 [Phlebopus sp. FC_14]